MHGGNNLLVFTRLVKGLAQRIYVDVHNYFLISNISTACDEQCSVVGLSANVMHIRPCKLPLPGARPPHFSGVGGEGGGGLVG